MAAPKIIVRTLDGFRMRVYPEQSNRQRERAKRYENHTNSLTGHVTHGLKPTWRR